MLTCSSLCRSGWPQNHRDQFVSAFPVLRLKACVPHTQLSLPHHKPTSASIPKEDGKLWTRMRNQASAHSGLQMRNECSQTVRAWAAPLGRAGCASNAVPLAGRAPWVTLREKGEPRLSLEGATTCAVGVKEPGPRHRFCSI